MTILPLLNLVLTLRKGFVYLLDMDIYTYRLAFSSILHFILVQVAQNLAPVACLCNGNQYSTIHMHPPFRIATNPREN